MYYTHIVRNNQATGLLGEGSGAGYRAYPVNHSVFKNSQVTGNVAFADYGGGIIVANIHSEGRDSYFADNHAITGSGGALGEGSSGTNLMSNLTFENNTAGLDGASLQYAHGIKTAEHSTFKNGVAGRDGGVSWTDCQTSWVNNTMENNSAGRFGWAISTVFIEEIPGLNGPHIYCENGGTIPEDISSNIFKQPPKKQGIDNCGLSSTETGGSRCATVDFFPTILQYNNIVNACFGT